MIGWLLLLFAVGIAVATLIFVRRSTIADVPPDTMARSATPPVFQIRVNYSATNMAIHEVILARLYKDGQAVTSGVSWSISPGGVVTSTGDVGNMLRITAIAGGTFTLTASTAQGGAQLLGSVKGPAPVPTPTPAPTPPPPPSAPAKGWKRTRPHITMVSTNFYYNWLASMYPVYARRYDVVYSGTDAVTTALKSANANLHRLKYALQVTTIASAGSVETGYEPDYTAWCVANSIDAASAEMGYLHVPGGTTAGTRISTPIWGSARHVPDPSSDVMRRYQVNRLQRVSAGAALVDGLMLDEFGSNPMRGVYALACGGDATKLQALCDAETSLIALIQKAMAPKQLVLNTASYGFAWDKALTIAAFGTHMEETNNPLVLEMAGQWWPYIDGLLAAGCFVNMVPPYQFGEYESQHDAQTAPALERAHVVVARQRERWRNHPVRGQGSVLTLDDTGSGEETRALIAGANYMDTHRGKLLEVASYYMVVTDPALCGLSIENGDWAKYTPVQNWMPEIDAPIGLALIPRRRVDGTARFVGRGHCFERRFANGLVVANTIPDRNPANYGDTGGGTYTLPTDVSYYRVQPNGQPETAATVSLVLRCPEAAIFVCSPAPVVVA